jgi:SAM-dependent methyltransferase
VACGSLERQRANRRVLSCFPIGSLARLRALQFSLDSALSGWWFGSLEVSVYGGANSLDLQCIDRPSGSYDFVSLSHVLEFVVDDAACVSELARILSPHGVINLILSAPLGRERSLDFATAAGPHQHFHLYGRDFAERFDFAARGLGLLVVRSTDPVTQTEEAIHFISRSAATLGAIDGFVAAAAVCDPASLFGSGHPCAASIDRGASCLLA